MSCRRGSSTPFGRPSSCRLRRSRTLGSSGSAWLCSWKIAIRSHPNRTKLAPKERRMAPAVSVRSSGWRKTLVAMSGLSLSSGKARPTSLALAVDRGHSGEAALTVSRHFFSVVSPQTIPLPPPPRVTSETRRPALPSVRDGLASPLSGRFWPAVPWPYPAAGHSDQSTCRGRADYGYGPADAVKTKSASPRHAPGRLRPR